jgi:hypothetical protein
VKVSCSLYLAPSLNFSATLADEKRRGGCPNDDRWFEEGCLVSLTVFDLGDSVTLSSHFFSSSPEDPHHFGGWICCRVYVERGEEETVF